ncbi:PAS domain-containing hybrid sensor histidine kinase/response regulator [Mucilaginibacter glaciei]|uniref:histidine kinase n=1 Tax=Mucilaginibacter glaciei TaxID=2772109 RepID=A0A926S2B9_9SPHI|nr:PAS domain S-box protein [Mucilaginibacter glaciei]MBD1394960.1 PAS domain S-box protein [Mucilaginibacter glaciei]
MSFKEKALQLIENDNTIHRLLLIGLFIAAPSLHYLCSNNSSFDPLWLRVVTCALCAITLGVSFGSNKNLYNYACYLTIAAYSLINNGVLLSVNGFAHVYIFGAVTIFIALTLFCKKKWEFIAVTLLNLSVVLTAYFAAPVLFIAPKVLIVLLFVFVLIAYVSYLVMTSYQVQFKKAINRVLQLNESLRNSQDQLHALISSVNDTIFEFDENRICVNVWFGPHTPAHLTRETFLNKTLIDAIGPDRAAPFNKVYDFVLANRQSSTIEFPSIYGEPGWFLAKSSPVIDVNGNYTKRISVTVTDITRQKAYDDALIENKNLLQQAQAIAKTGNWWYDNITKETFWSDNLYSVLEIDAVPGGMSKFEYYLQLVHPDDAAFTARYFTNIQNEAENSIEHKFITPKGNTKYLKILRGDLHLNADGKLQRVVGITQDVTDARLAEKAVKKSQKELLEAQAIAKIGNWKWDSGTNILSWSDEINSIYEVDSTNSVQSRNGKLLIKYIHPDDRYIIKYFLHGPEAMGQSYEYRIITPLGNVKHISVIWGKIMKREDGSVRRIIGTLQDITQRKQAEIDYKTTENKYRLVLETIKLAAVSLDATGNVIFCNKYLANLLGYSQLEILGMNWMQNFVPKDLREFLKSWFVDNTVEAHYINPVICRNGDLRTISWQNTITYDDYGNLKGTTSIGEDITLQQKARQELITAKEKAERSSHFKSEFLSIMSHEIRTPMNAVIGTTNLLLSENPRPEQLEYLNTLKFSSENLLAIINDILDYNKIEAGKLLLNHAPFNIHQLVQNVRQSFYAKALEKNLEIELHTDSSIPEYVMGDQTRLGQILINLVNNAVKFTSVGKVSIVLEQEQINDAEVLINFKVIDTGIGISAESLEVIFDPFIQEEQVINHEYGGTGLGLAITKRLIELYQSSIKVISDLGKGTQFSFAILFDLAEVALPATMNPIIVNVPMNLSGMNILVVDDNRMNIMIASKFLKKWQANVDEALNGQIAVNMATNKVYDMIIMDLQMPVMDGFEASRQIKKLYPDMPIIAFTADAMPETHNKAFEAGMCDYLTKPFVPEALFEKITQHRKEANPLGKLGV